MAKSILAVALVSVALAILSAWLFSPRYDLPPVENYSVFRHSNPLFIDTIERYPARLSVVNTSKKVKVGIDISPEMFDFGNLSLSTQARKKITITNPTKYSAKIRILARGNISKIFRSGVWNGDWKEEHEFILKPGQKRTIDIGAVANRTGYYEGEIWIYSRLARNALGSLLVVVA